MEQYCTVYGLCHILQISHKHCSHAEDALEKSVDSTPAVSVCCQLSTIQERILHVHLYKWLWIIEGL